MKSHIDATFKVLSAKIGKHGSATHHSPMSSARCPSHSPDLYLIWPEVVEYAGKLAAALRDEDLTEWRNLVSDAKPFLEEGTHLASRLGAKGSSVFRIIGLAFLVVEP